jgi:hypothetical protein
MATHVVRTVAVLCYVVAPARARQRRSLRSTSHPHGPRNQVAKAPASRRGTPPSGASLNTLARQLLARRGHGKEEHPSVAHDSRRPLMRTASPATPRSPDSSTSPRRACPGCRRSQRSRRISSRRSSPSARATRSARSASAGPSSCAPPGRAGPSSAGGGHFSPSRAIRTGSPGGCRLGRNFPSRKRARRGDRAIGDLPLDDLAELVARRRGNRDTPVRREALLTGLGVRACRRDRAIRDQRAGDEGRPLPRSPPRHCGARWHTPSH